MLNIEIKLIAMVDFLFKKLAIENKIYLFENLSLKMKEIR
jgi:hypothetical protein